MIRSAVAITLILCAAAAATTERPAAPAPYRLVETRHVGQWTSRDSRAARKLDLRATDLGVSFPIISPTTGWRELTFLFGDTHPFGEPQIGRWDEDSIAVAPVDWPRRDRLPPLKFLTRADGQFLSLLVPGEDLRAMDVPLDGIQLDSRVLLFFNAAYDVKRHAHAFLVCAEATNGDFANLVKRFKQPSRKFLNVSVSRDPTDEETIWIFGTGHYRRSPVYLARATAATLDDFGSWRFFVADAWTEREEEATPLIEGRMGELSARWIPAAQQWALAYQRRRPGLRGQGVYVRFAPHPTGPWSQEVPLLEPDATHSVGFTRFMHARESVVGFDDGLANPGREDDWGDPYGPYLVPEWCRVEPSREGARLHLVHVLSGWNPYAVHLMEAVLTASPEALLEVADGQPAAPFAPPPFPPLDAFAVDGAKRSVQWTVPPGATWLSFHVTGAGTSARLLNESGLLLRESRGRPSGELPRRARWRIDDYRGRTLTFVVLTGRGGNDDTAALTQPTVELSP